MSGTTTSDPLPTPDGGQPQLAELGLTAGMLKGRLATWPRRRAELAELTTLLVAAEPALQHAPERRVRLAEVIAELVEAGVVELPAKRSYDRSAKPFLPRFLKLDRPSPAPRRRSGASIAWRSELAWAGELSLDEQTFADLRTVNAFLRDGGAQRMVVPMRERSVELFGDEKRLEALMGGQLFFPGRLTLEQLRCEQIHPPFVHQRIGAGHDALVVENHHTYVSLSRTLPPDGDIGWLIYGAGAHFKASVAYLGDMPTATRRVLYFGDLDAAGLEIPIHASAAATASGLPPVQAASALYRLLLDHGLAVPVHDPPTRERVRELTAWLSEDVRAAAASMLITGKRLAQEWVGMETLATRRDLLRML